MNSELANINGARPIKILRIIARLNVGGPAKHVTWVCSGLDSSNQWQNTLMHGLVEENEDDYSVFADGAKVNRKVIPQLKRSINLASDFMTVLKIYFWMVRNRPLIMHTHASKAGFAGRFAGLLYRLTFPFNKLVVLHTFHGHTFHGYFSPLKERIFLLIERLLAALATNHILTISKLQQQEIRDKYRVGSASQHVLLPLGIDTKFAEELDCKSLRHRFGLDENVFTFGIVGRIAPIKDHSLFIEACACLCELNPKQPTAFIIIGGGSEAEIHSLKQLALKLNLQNLYFAGNVNDPREIYGAIDGLVLTSKNEGTPVSILESFACRIPVVSTLVGGVEDLIGSNNERGIGVIRDKYKIAEAMHSIMDSNTDLELKLSAAQQFVIDKYSVERLVSDLSRLYRSSLN